MNKRKRMAMLKHRRRRKKLKLKRKLLLETQEQPLRTRQPARVAPGAPEAEAPTRRRTIRTSRTRPSRGGPRAGV